MFRPCQGFGFGDGVRFRAVNFRSKISDFKGPPNMSLQTELEFFGGLVFYKYAAPTVLRFRLRQLRRTSRRDRNLILMIRPFLLLQAGFFS
jgi:hypothetical protein